MHRNFGKSRDFAVVKISPYLDVNWVRSRPRPDPAGSGELELAELGKKLGTVKILSGSSHDESTTSE
jgi:hypothetical protein